MSGASLRTAGTPRTDAATRVSGTRSGASYLIALRAGERIRDGPFITFDGYSVTLDGTRHVLRALPGLPGRFLRVERTDNASITPLRR
jgi:hypothetical protein